MTFIMEKMFLYEIIKTQLILDCFPHIFLFNVKHDTVKSEDELNEYEHNLMRYSSNLLNDDVPKFVLKHVSNELGFDFKFGTISVFFFFF